MTRTQWTTLIALAAYIFWEVVYLADWKAQTVGAQIRIDLLVIYPLLAVLVLISVVQAFRR